MEEASLKINITGIDPENGFFNEFEQPTREQWKNEAVAALKGAPFDKIMYTTTYEGLTIEPMYHAEDLEGLPHLDSKPGFPPFVRGTKPNGFVNEPWKISQELTQSLPEEFNTEARFDIARGQTGLTMVLDRPSRLGSEPAVASAEEVGNHGLSLSSLADLKLAISGIDLEKTDLLCYSGAVSLPLIAMLAAAIEDDGKNMAALKNCIGCDPLGELASDGRLEVSIKAAYDSMYQTIAWSLKHAPRLRTVFILGHPYHNAGASSTQEVAFALATAAEYLREMITRGLTVDEVAPRMRFGFSLGSNFFMEIAKLRAARMLWSKVVSAFGGNEESQKMSIHGRSSAFNKTVLDPYVNMLRITSEGFSGAVGGADSMHLAPFDEPIRTPDRFSRRIARNVQIMLQEESNFTIPIDLGGGSYYIEKLTAEFAGNVWNMFRDIEKNGGMTAALVAGTPQALSVATAAKRSESIEHRHDMILGTNMYANLSEKRIETPVMDHDALKRLRAAAVADYRKQHVHLSLAGQLSAFEHSFSDAGSNAVDAAIVAIREGALLSDISEVIADLDSARISVIPLNIFRAAEPFEKLRKMAELHYETTGTRPRVFLANMGPVAQHKPRADFSAAFFETAGFEILGSTGFASTEEAAEAAIASGVDIIVICSTDVTYPEYVPVVAARVKADRPDATLLVAGRQAPEVESAFLAAGVDGFIHAKANCYEINRKLQEKYVGEEQI